MSVNIYVGEHQRHMTEKGIQIIQLCQNFLTIPSNFIM